MDQNNHRSTSPLEQRIAARTERARKRARLIVSQIDSNGGILFVSESAREFSIEFMAQCMCLFAIDEQIADDERSAERHERMRP